MTARDKSRIDGQSGVQVQRLTNVFQHYRRAIAKVVARIVRPHDVEDIVQETYIRIYQAAQKERIFHPRSFMVRTARNLALNHLARSDALNYLAETLVHHEADSESPPSPEELAPAANGESPDERLQAEQEFLLFCRSVRDLPLQCRRAFILRKVYGISQREVAKQLGLSESTVEKHIAKGITAARAYMQLHGYATWNGKRARPRPASVGRRGG
jgi:RNA polymerase sigma factor (sigma-70 family)